MPDRPRVHLNWHLSELDFRSIRRGHEILAEAVRSAGLGEFAVALGSKDDSWQATTKSGYHHMGTTRMHSEPRYGVVNADGRVHGISNLFVAGSSIFPTAGYVNPTLTIVALAIRLADHVQAQLG